jgi:protein-S-isoprenylcysteine O-methyltransferase Ste14
MSPLKKIFEKQLLHLLYLMLLLAGLFLFSNLDGFREGGLWGVETITWLYLLVGITVIHQVFVWFCWRTELYAGWLSRWLGHRAFAVYALLFFLLIVSRPLFITFLAIANKDTIPINHTVSVILVTFLAAPSIYLMYSIARYFGFKRAFGIDHFDSSYKGKPLVKKGIFRYTSNGMYVFGLLILWMPGVLFSSLTALAGALFSHIYIWVHYSCTEKPDMGFIYGQRSPMGGAARDRQEVSSNPF